MSSKKKSKPTTEENVEQNMSSDESDDSDDSDVYKGNEVFCFMFHSNF